MEKILKTRKEVAAELGINVKTLYLDLQKGQIETSSGRLAPCEVEKIKNYMLSPNRKLKPPLKDDPTIP